jgi:6,7-dimethyl-8-ribityllumazine synthase
MKKKICIVLASYYEEISKNLYNGAIKVVPNSKLINVPGVFEIPVAISKVINDYDAFVALGCVIKGETPHFDFISQSATNAIMSLSIDNKKPIGNGIITCLNVNQALKRSDPLGKNKGAEAAEAVFSILGI